MPGNRDERTSDGSHRRTPGWRRGRPDRLPASLCSCSLASDAPYVVGPPGAPRRDLTEEAARSPGRRPPGSRLVTGGHVVRSVVMRAVRFDQYGGADVLEVREVYDPVDADGRAIVAVRPPASTPARARSARAMLAERWPATFPWARAPISPEWSERRLGRDRDPRSETRSSVGPTNAPAHAELVVGRPSTRRSPKPRSLSWEVAGSMHVVAMAAPGIGPCGGPRTRVSCRRVGGRGRSGFVRRAARPAHRRHRDRAGRRGATTIGCGRAGVVPVAYGDGQADRSAAPPAPTSTRSSTRSAAATSTWRSSSASLLPGSTRSSTVTPVARKA